MLEPSEYRQRYRHFLSRLKEARTDAGLTQGEVARRLRKPQSFVSKCESGERRVDFVELLAFAKLYGIDDVSSFDPENIS
jgi:transcriptional regulator with XRE-family HTH domain